MSRQIEFINARYQFSHSIYISQTEAKEFFLIKSLLAFVVAFLITLLTAGTTAGIIASTIANVLTSLAGIIKFDNDTKKYIEEAKKLIYGKLYGKGIALLDEVAKDNKKYRLNLNKIKIYADNSGKHQKCCEGHPACKKMYQYVPTTIIMNINPMLLMYLLIIIKSDNKYKHLISDDDFSKLIVILSLIAKFYHGHSNMPTVDYRYAIRKDALWRYILEVKGKAMIHKFKLILPYEYEQYNPISKEMLMYIVNDPNHNKYFHLPEKEIFLAENEYSTYHIMNHEKILLKWLVENSNSLSIKSTTNALYITGQLERDIDIGIRLRTKASNIAEYSILSMYPQLTFIINNAVLKKSCPNHKNVNFVKINEYFKLEEILDVFKIEWLKPIGEYVYNIDYYDKDLYEEYMEEKKDDKPKDDKPKDDKPKDDKPNNEDNFKKENKTFKILIMFFMALLLWILMKE